MPDQLNIDGGAEPIRATDRPERHETVRLFDFPQTMRGQLDWSASSTAPPHEQEEPRHG